MMHDQQNLFGPMDEPLSKSAPRIYPKYAKISPEQAMEAYPDGLTYGVPDEFVGVQIGDRVSMPLGRGKKTVRGYVLSLSEQPDLDPAKIKPINAIEPVNFPPDLIELAQWISRYYIAPLGMVFATMIPAAVKHGIGRKSVNLVQLPENFTAGQVGEIVRNHKLPPKQKATLDAAIELHAAGRLPINPGSLATMAGSRSKIPIHGLVSKGLLEFVKTTQVSAQWSQKSTEKIAPHELNEEQSSAVKTVSEALGKAQNFVLYGVTGSGKTEVYLSIIEKVVQRGQGAIVLVPEIALTPQTASRFLGRFDRVALLHSGLTDAQRHEQWQRIREGWAQVVVGARSAIFAPMTNLGIVVVDEEHDSSYKQDQAPRYHGRDIAVKRANSLNIPCLLGSATPSLESWNNAINGRYKTLKLTRRATNAAMPKVHVVDMNAQRKIAQQIGGPTAPLISGPLDQAIQKTLAEKMQIMLLLNRRGYASYIACPSSECGWIMRCNHCDTNLVYHLNQKVPAGGFLRCHYCGFENRMPTSCPEDGKRLIQLNPGSQKAEQVIRERYPEARLLRMDSDAMRTGSDYENALDQFRQGEVDILLGTQMIAKGLDFPKVRLVGVLSADTALHMTDFRAGERAFQLISQVAGRSGRSSDGGQVFVQTYEPNHPAIQYAVNHDFEGFAKMELNARQRVYLPPYHRMVNIITRDKSFDKANALAVTITKTLNQIIEENGYPAVARGPIEPGVNRIRDYYRMRVEAFAADAGTLIHLLSKARQTGVLISDRHRAVDVDPVVVY